jgi:hypothetical protein
MLLLILHSFFHAVPLGQRPWGLAILAAIRRALSRVNKLRRHLTFSAFSFTDNNTATSRCHGSVLYSGSIFREM